MSLRNYLLNRKDIGNDRYKMLLATFRQHVKAAGGVLYLDARKADGSLPLTGNSNPWVDLSGNNSDGTLTNFAGSGTSGWQDPPPVLRFDGLDDFVAFADAASLDVINAPFGIACTIKVSTDHIGFVSSKGLGSVASTQYGLLLRTGRLAEFYQAGTAYAQFIADTANYVNILFYWDGINVTSYENGIQKTQTALVGPLTSYGLFKIGKRDVDTSFFNGDIGTYTQYTGSDINKILKAEAKISAQYLALNP